MKVMKTTDVFGFKDNTQMFRVINGSRTHAHMFKSPNEMKLFFSLTLTTALLYWSGRTDELLPVRVDTSHSRRTSSILQTD